MAHTRRSFVTQIGAWSLAGVAAHVGGGQARLRGAQPQGPSEQLSAPARAEHVTIWRQPQRYGGWPANHGMWSWNNELLVGFSAGHLHQFDPERHPVDRTRPEQHLLSRSLDGGRTWQTERPDALRPPPQPGHMSGVPTEPGGRMPQPLDAPLVFTQPDTIITLRMADNHTGPSWFYTSHDRGRTWRGPWALPAFDSPGITARTDYVVRGPRHVVAFVTAAKPDGREGRPLAIETRDGGMTWQRLGWMTPQVEGWRIMPTTVRLADGRFYSVVRARDDGTHRLVGVESADEGRTWTQVAVPVADAGRGNPGALLRLADGRLCLSYGHRARPFGIRAVLSRDDGRTWGRPVVLRDDAADWDVGYPCAVQRPDGAIVTAYYFNDAHSPERYIAATIWHPDERD